MVGIGMAEQHQIQLAHAQSPQYRHHHPLAEVRPTQRRAGIVEHRVLAGAQDECQPLTNIKLPDLHLPMGNFRLRCKHCQQHQGPAQHAHRQALGHQQQ
ncbi:hypothetical protein D3C76_1128460 [compost metagenome]